MATIEQIRRLAIHGTSQGLDKVQAELRAIVEAQNDVASSSAQMATVTEPSARRQTSVAGDLRKVESALDGVSRATQAYERQQRVLTAALQQGAITEERHAQLLAQSRAAMLASTTAANDRMKAQMRALVDEAERVKDSSYLTADAMEAMERRAAALRAQLDPLGTAQARLASELADFDDMARRGVITQTELAEASARSRAAFDETSRSLKPLNDNIRLTSDQTRNLMFQFNDGATMLLSGSSFFQVAATQGGQVVQALGDGPGGVRGSLTAIGASLVGLMTPMNVAIAGVAALSAGALFFATRGRESVKPVTEAMEAHQKAVRDVADAYGFAADQADKMARVSASLASFNARQSREELELSARSSLRAGFDQSLMESVTGDRIFGGRIGGEGRDALKVYEQFAAFEAPLTKLFDGMAKGTAQADKFVEEIARLANLDPTNEELQKAAERLIKIASEAASAQRQLRGLGVEFGKAAQDAKAFAEAADALSGFVPDQLTDVQKIEQAYQQMMRFAKTEADVTAAQDKRRLAMAELPREAIEQAKAARQALDNLSLSPNDRSLAEIRQRYDAEIAEIERVNGSEGKLAAKRQERVDALKAAEIEIARGEDARRANDALDLQSVTARTAAEKARIEGERARIAFLEQGHTAAQAAAEGERVAAISLAQARQQLVDSSRQQADATAQQIAQAQLEIDLVGKSAGETARLRAEAEMLAAARQAAVAAGFDASEVQLTDAMKEQAAEIGRLTEATQRLNFERDVLFERRQATRSPEEQQIASDLRSMGVEYESAQGRADAAQLRLNNRLHEANDLLWEMRDTTKDAFGDVVKAIGLGENAFEAFADAITGWNQRMASAGLDRLFDMFTGGQAGFSPASGGGTIGKVLGAITGGGGGGVTSVSASGTYGYSAPAAKISAADFAQASGQMMQYAGRFNSSVDGRLLKILNEASSRFDMRVEAISGLRPGDSRFHGKGLATDVQIYGADGHALGNYQDASTFRTYERFAQLSRQVQQELFPELEGMLRWGGYFSGGKGKYGALDTMHFDLGGNRVGMGGGSWEGGLTSAMRRIWSGAESVGMGAGGQDALARAVSVGYVDGARKIATGAVPGLDPWGGNLRDGSGNLSPTVQVGGGAAQSGGGGFFQSPLFQGGMTALGAGMAGYQSGSPIGGALNGALAGLATGNPIMAGVGAISGLIGGLFGSSKQKKAEEEARKQREAQQAQMAAQLASQIEDLQSYFNRSPDDNMASELRSVDQKIRELRASIKNDGIASEDQVDGIEREALAYKAMLVDEFRDVADKLTVDLSGGLGLDTEFTKARDVIRAIGKEARGHVEDTREAFRVPTEMRDAILADYKDAERAAAKGYNSATKYADRIRRAPGGDYSEAERRDADRAVVDARKDMDAALASAKADRDKALAAYEASVVEMQRRYDEAVTKAVEAGRASILRAISGDVVEQTEIEKALDQSRGAAAAASWELQQLGLSAETAAAQIAEHLGKRSTRLRTDFERGVEEAIEDLDGKGYLADVRGLLEERGNKLKDAGLLGSDAARVEVLFAKSAQAIVDGATLTGDAFAELIKLFPDLAGVVHAFSQDIKETIRQLTDRVEGYDERRFSALENTTTLAGAMSAFNRRTARERFAEGEAGGQGMLALEAAQAAEKVAMIQGLVVRARQDEVSVLDATISRLSTFTDGIDDLRASMKLDPNLSPLNAQERFLEAQKQFREISAKAAAGDEEAQAKLASVTQDYLEEARSFYASTPEYYDIFKKVDGTLGDTQSVAERQLDLAKDQLDIAEKQLEALEGVKDGLADLLKAYADAQAAAAAAAAAAGAGGGIGAPGGGGTGGAGGTGGSGNGGLSFVPKNDLEHFLGVQYGAILGRAPDASGIGYYQALRDKGATADDIIAMIKASPEAKGRDFMRGGFTGWGGVGQVAGDVHGQEYVFDAAATRAIGVPMLDQMRQARRLPLTMPYLPAPAAGNDNGSIVRAILSLNDRFDQLGAIVMASDAETRAELARGNRIAGITQQALQLEAA